MGSVVAVAVLFAESAGVVACAVALPCGSGAAQDSRSGPNRLRISSNCRKLFTCEAPFLPSADFNWFALPRILSGACWGHRGGVNAQTEA
jgi:hypothetical protein